jgi:SAM-dependent methyltransferase
MNPVAILLWVLAAAHAGEAVGLRRRWRQIPALPAGPQAGGVTESEPKVDVVAVAGAEVDAATVAGAAAVLELGGVQVLDLVPGDYPADRTLRLLRRVSPAQLHQDVLYSPGGAHEVMVLDPSVTGRMARAAGSGLGNGPNPTPHRLADQGAMVRWTVDAQRHAPVARSLRRAPGLRSRRWTPTDRWREIEEVNAHTLPALRIAPLLLGIETAHLATLTLGVLVSPMAGLAALLTWAAQPVVVQGVSRLGVAVARLPRAWADNVRTAVAGWGAARAAAVDRAAQPVPAPPPIGELFEPGRSTCPWCGSVRLVRRLDTEDMFQHKVGTFHLDRCDDCGHVFQNPAVSQRGLDYYYDQFYDGVSEEQTEVIFASLGRSYRDRVEAVAQFTEPRAWLDVGTGHGHFCLVARQRWPEARVDGLDMSETVEEAQRRGWVDTAYRGLFHEQADGLAWSYDVVSMHHYLEHTREPRQEIAAAAKVLEPGGYLMIEVPDPESSWARLGRFWLCWMQPQHLHFIPCGNLVAALDETGFDVLSIERGPATMGADLSAALVLLVEHLARSPHYPWLPPPSVGHRIKRIAVGTALLPAIGLALLVDKIKDARIRPEQVGNAYRVVARRRFLP